MAKNKKMNQKDLVNHAMQLASALRRGTELAILCLLIAGSILKDALHNAITESEAGRADCDPDKVLTSVKAALVREQPSLASSYAYAMPLVAAGWDATHLLRIAVGGRKRELPITELVALVSQNDGGTAALAASRQLVLMRAAYTRTCNLRYAAAEGEEVGRRVFDRQDEKAAAFLADLLAACRKAGTDWIRNPETDLAASAKALAAKVTDRLEGEPFVVSTEETNGLVRVSIKATSALSFGERIARAATTLGCGVANVTASVWKFEGNATVAKVRRAMRDVDGATVVANEGAIYIGKATDVTRTINRLKDEAKRASAKATNDAKATKKASAKARAKATNDAKASAKASKVAVASKVAGTRQTTTTKRAASKARNVTQKSDRKAKRARAKDQNVSAPRLVKTAPPVSPNATA